MATTMLRAPHIGTLTSVSPNTKIPRFSSTGKKVQFVPTSRLTSFSSPGSSYKPLYVLTKDEISYHKLLAAAPAILQQLGIHTSVAPSSPKMSLRHTPSPRASTPVTPPVTSKKSSNCDLRRRFYAFHHVDQTPSLSALRIVSCVKAHYTPMTGCHTPNTADLSLQCCKVKD